MSQGVWQILKNVEQSSVVRSIKILQAVYFNKEETGMRELGAEEVRLVSGGNDAPPQTMGVGCFSAMVLIGISPFMGPTGMIGAFFNAMSACEGVDFTS